MTNQEAKQKEKQLTELFKSKYPDIISHVDLINETEEINISFFWNRISKERWNDAKTYRIKAVDYQKVLETEIIPFFN